MRLAKGMLELVFIAAMSGLLWVLFNIPFAKAGPFSLIIVGAVGFSLISVIQGYIHLVGKYELPLGNYVVSLFMGRPNGRLEKISVHSRDVYNRR